MAGRTTRHVQPGEHHGRGRPASWRGLRFASPDDRMAIIERATDLALGGVIQVTAPELHHTPSRYRREDGTSRLRPGDHHLYTTESLLDAEKRLLAAGRDTDSGDGPRRHGRGRRGAEPARQGLRHVRRSGASRSRRSPPPGAGWTCWSGRPGPGRARPWRGCGPCGRPSTGRVRWSGSAPSAAAAEVLGDELGIDTENTAKWLHEHRQTGQRREQLAAIEAKTRRSQPTTDLSLKDWLEQARRLRDSIDRWQFRPGQLVIVDEASLAGTFALDELIDCRRPGRSEGPAGRRPPPAHRGRRRRHVPHPRRATATTSPPNCPMSAGSTTGGRRPLRSSCASASETAIDAYEAHGRIGEGDRDTLLDAIYTAWRGDVLEGGKAELDGRRGRGDGRRAEPAGQGRSDSRRAGSRARFGGRRRADRRGRRRGGHPAERAPCWRPARDG